jgi:hypothetical protein
MKNSRRQFMILSAAGQKCDNCALYQGKLGSPAGGCSLFAGKQVAGPGWCSAYAKKA